MYIEFVKGKKFPANDADTSDDLSIFEDAGYVLEEDELVIDIDCLTHEAIEALIRYFGIETETVWTERGVHFYFEKPTGFRGAKRVCQLAFEVEFKHTKNTKAVKVKRDGVVRKIDNPGARQALPPIFEDKRKFDSLLGLSDGDGRNNKMFLHRQKLGNKEGWMNVMRYINNFVLADPLEEDELNTLLRKIESSESKVEEYAMGVDLIKRLKAVVYGGVLHYYHEGEYKTCQVTLRHIVSNECLDRKSAFIDEVIKQMEYRAEKIADDKVFDIHFPNGVLRDGVFYDVISDEFTPYFVPINYNPDAPPVEIVDEYLNNLTKGDPNYRNLVLEVLGHTLITNKEFKRLLAKFFIFVGDGGNGKGTLLAIIRRILGDKSCTALTIAELADERYFVTLKGKLANLGDDIDDAPINEKQMRRLKTISTCDFVSTRELFKQSSETEMTCSLIFTSNHILKSFEKGTSYKRRALWLPMYTKPKKKDPLFITKLTTDEALEYWIRLVVEGYQRLYKNMQFTETVVVKEFNESYHQENNGANLFLDDYEAEDILGRRNQELYDEFEVWCNENDVKASRKMLYDGVYERFKLKIGVKKIQGKTQRVFVLDENATEV